METKQPQAGLVPALFLAYRAVKALGFSHQRLVNEHHEVNHNTLRRIRDGRAGKLVTDEFYLKLFMTLLNGEYHRRMENGGDHVFEILNEMRKINLTLLKIPL